MSKPNILQILPSLSSGGVERGVVDIANYLHNQGYKSYVLSSGGKMVDKLPKGAHIKLNVASKNPVIILYNIFRIISIIKRFSIGIIHARSRAPAWSGYFACKITKTIFITTVHGPYKITNPFKRLYNSIMVKGDMIIAVSYFIKKYILDNYNVNEKKIKVIPRGADYDYFDPIKANLNKEFKNKYDIKSNVPVLLLPGRFTYWKGHELLIAALSNVNEDYYCIMVGDIAKKPYFVQKLRNKIIELKLSDKIKIFESESDMLNLYRISDMVFSLSTEPEAFGRTVIEAQAMEKLVIASNIGGAAETIEDKITGIHVKSDDVDDLVNKIKYCLSILRTEVADEICKKARQNVINDYSLKQMQEKTEKIYKTLWN